MHPIRCLRESDAHMFHCPFARSVWFSYLGFRSDVFAPGASIFPPCLILIILVSPLLNHFHALIFGKPGVICFLIKQAGPLCRFFMLPQLFSPVALILLILVGPVGFNLDSMYLHFSLISYMHVV
ncbi:hypothetical protein VPH35_128546 [Triticum aestivum]